MHFEWFCHPRINTITPLLISNWWIYHKQCWDTWGVWNYSWAHLLLNLGRCKKIAGGRYGKQFTSTIILLNQHFLNVQKNINGRYYKNGHIFSPKNFKSQINLFFIIIFVARLLAPNQTRDARFPDNCIKEFSSNNIVPISRQFEIPLSMAISIDFLGIRQKTS